MAEDLTGVEICQSCVLAQFLQEKIACLGSVGRCAFCSRSDITVLPILGFPNLLWPVLYGRYGHVPDDWPSMKTKSIEELIAELAGVSGRVADFIRKAFYHLTVTMALKWPAPDAWTPGARYLANGRDDRMDEVDRIWKEIGEELNHGSRYFNRAVKAYFDRFLKDIGPLRTVDGTPLIETLAAGTRIFRARVALDDGQLNKILEFPTRELGPPPAASARPGRLNAAGTALLYAALGRDTCVAEVRPPVGSRVVVGAFVPRRDLTILNLRSSDNLRFDADPFSAEYDDVRLRWAFLRSLASRLSAPVMPHTEIADYRATQAACEYIAHEIDIPRIEGILYPSSQSGSTGVNVALFLDAEAVEQWHSSQELYAHAHVRWEDEEIDSYVVQRPQRRVPGRDYSFGPFRPWADVALVRNDVQVVHVLQVLYETKWLDVDYSDISRPTRALLGD